jgi:hypothetical protein
MNTNEFWDFARERHSIYLRRAAGDPPPWTDDPVLRTYRFCNIFRELDATTAWFRRYVRDPMRSRPEVLLATVLFRWFNRISSGEALFCQTDLASSTEGGLTAFEMYLQDHDPTNLVAALRQSGPPPYVTGSYIVLGKRGMPKMEGVVAALHDFAQGLWPIPEDVGRANWSGMAVSLLENRDEAPYTLEGVWRTLCQVPYLGPFMAYEVVTDLRHTALLDRAPDVVTWANPGPGARRGADRLLGRSERRSVTMRTGRVYQHVSKSAPDAALEVIRVLVAEARDPLCWPSDWPAWEAREAEHTLCEYDKWVRTRLGQGRPRQKFRGGRA